MLTWVIYDITKDKTRTKIAKRLGISEASVYRYLRVKP